MRNTANLIPVYEALAHDIKNLGVDTVFGLMSDDTAMFCATLDAIGIRFYGARHENNACSMAEGYAAATGRLGIAVLGRGPATANALHGSVYAQRTGSRVLLIYGAESVSPPAMNGLGPETKYINAQAVLQAAGIKTHVASHATTARQALADAVGSTLQGAAVLLLPMNVQFGKINPEHTAPVGADAKAPAIKPPRAAAISAAACLLEGAKKPLILAGLGAHRAGAREALMRLADHTGAALVTTLKAKDMFRGHPANAGVPGSFSTAGGRRLIEQADCIIAFGAGLNMRTTSYGMSLPADVRLIQVDVLRSNIGRWFHADVAVIGDARVAAEKLVEALPARAAADKPLHAPEVLKRLADFDLADDFEAANTPRTLDVRVAALELDRLLPERRDLVWDSGNFLQMIPYIGSPGPDCFKMASDFSSIGMGFGTAMGFACGAPDRPTVFLCGDGSFFMNMGEIETVAREDIPLVIVVLNDCVYGAEVHYLKMREMPVNKSVFLDIDLAPVAEAFGFQTATVRTVEDLRTLAPLLAKPEGPILIDVKINGNIPAAFLLEGIEHEKRAKAG